MGRGLPPWQILKSSAPDHVSPPPKLVTKPSSKHEIEHIAYRLECTCGHVPVWAATELAAISKWMNHLAIAAGLKKAIDHRKFGAGRTPRGRSDCNRSWARALPTRTGSRPISHVTDSL